MIKKVRVEQLKPGMYIHDMNCGWMENPFFTKSMKVKDEGMVSKIMDQGLREVYIDTKKGDDVKDAQTEQEVKKEINKEVAKIAEAKPEPVKDDSNYDPSEPPSVPVKEEIKKAKKIQAEAKKVVTDILEDARLGKQVELEKTDHVVKDMVDSVFRNKEALASLGRIKTADQYTFQHSVSVCVLMISFCKAIGVDKDTIHIVGQGAMLHDIGKMRVPPEILNKPGKLTDDEFIKMKSHALESRKILSETPGIVEEAVEVAAQHHERYDGSGYPEGLKGDQIGIYGQMAAIVDVYDAITSDRCYHKGMNSTDALKKIFEWSKFHFNKDLAQKYIRTVGIYPVGTLVRMKSGHIAVIVEPGIENIMKPTVRLVFNINENSYLSSPKDVNLAKVNGKGGGDAIMGNESNDKWGIDPMKYMDLF